MKNLSLSLCIMAFCLFSQGCYNHNSREHQGFPILSITNKYPEKAFFIDDADKEYIPLETTKEVLADQDFWLAYVSETHIVGRNGRIGDIFIFGRDGKIISHFNRKGNSGIEYEEIISIVFDEKRQEIFVADRQNKGRCAVYSIDGKFLRQFYFPENSWITDLHNFDDETLLAYNGYFKHFHDFEVINQIMPYVFLSKEDGSIVSRLDLSFLKRVSDDFMIKMNNMEIPFGIKTNNIVKYSQELIIADRSSDTVFLMTQDKNLTPLFARTPSIFSENPLFVICLNFRTDRYLFFNTLPISNNIWAELFTQFERGQRLSSPHSDFAYDFHTGQIFKIDHDDPLGRNVDAPQNTTVRLLFAYDLVEDLENGKLEGKLREIAQNIGEEDNPVVEIISWNR